MKDADGEIEGCHMTEDGAKAQLAALYASESSAEPVGEKRRVEFPRENLVRAVSVTPEVREQGDGKMPVLFGHFARYDEYNLIDSKYEGKFLERIQKGAFAKTFQENRDRFRLLFQHGRDPQVGDKPIASVTELREDEYGPYYEGEMLDTSYNRDIVAGLKAGVYGASYRFRVMRERVVEKPERSAHNPEGIPERTITEAVVYEAGPVTFPADPMATAGVRSMTDEYLAERIGVSRDEDTTTEAPPEREAPSEGDADVVTSPEERRDPEPSPEPTTEPRSDDVDANASLQELRARVDEIGTELQRLDAEVGTETMNDTQREQWDGLVAERTTLAARIADKERRLAVLEAEVEEKKRETTPATFAIKFGKSDRDIYDLSTVRGAFDNPEFARAELRDRALHAIERQNYPTLGREASREDMMGRVEHLLRNVDDNEATLARRVLVTGHPDYEPAFWKKLTGRGLSGAENAALERAALLVATAGYAMPIAIDPTVVLTSAGAVNPIRQLAHVVQIAGREWRGVNSAGITASFDGEGVEVSEDTPTLTQPTVTTLKAAAFVPFSIESEAWSDIRNELAVEMRDAKDVLEANKFTVGTGTTEPLGFMKAAYLATTAATATLALADIDTLMDALPPRFQPNASLLASRKFFSKVRQLSRTAGVNDSWPNVAPGRPGTVNGVPAYEASDIVSTFASSTLAAIYGDFERGYVIVDRIGMSVEYIPHLFHTTTNYPSGQRGIYAYWMTNGTLRSATTNVDQLRILKML